MKTDIKLALIFLAGLALNALLASCAFGTVQTVIVDQNDLKALFLEKNNERVLDFICDDFDAESTLEAFVITEHEKADGKAAKSLWYITVTAYMFVADVDDYAVILPIVIEHENGRDFAITFDTGNLPSPKSYIWSIKKGKPHIIFEKFCYISNEGNDFKVVYTRPGEFGGDGRTWTHFKLYWDTDKNEYLESYMYTEGTGGRISE